MSELQDDRAAIAKMSAALLSAVNASDADGCMAVWAADGVMMPPHHPSVRGRGAIGEYFRRLFASCRFTFSFTSSDVQIADDLAVERVTYSVVVSPLTGAAPADDAGKGLHVYARQADGSWKLVMDIWNSDRVS